MRSRKCAVRYALRNVDRTFQGISTRISNAPKTSTHSTKHRTQILSHGMFLSFKWRGWKKRETSARRIFSHHTHHHPHRLHTICTTYTRNTTILCRVQIACQTMIILRYWYDFHGFHDNSAWNNWAVRILWVKGGENWICFGFMMQLKKRWSSFRTKNYVCCFLYVF